eukprot:3849047-Pleurochrysis_carterae.AAC.1
MGLWLASRACPRRVADAQERVQGGAAASQDGNSRRARSWRRRLVRALAEGRQHRLEQVDGRHAQGTREQQSGRRAFLPRLRYTWADRCALSSTPSLLALAMLVGFVSRLVAPEP